MSSTRSSRSRATGCASSSAPTTRTCSPTRARTPTSPRTSRCIEPGDTVMGMRLDQGGHLTHGSPVNITGKLFDFVAYGVDRETERIDYDEFRATALEHRPEAHRRRRDGLPAPARLRDVPLDRRRVRRAAHGRRRAHRRAHRGRRAPVARAYADIVTLTTHKTLRGPRAGAILCREEYASAIDSAVFPGLAGRAARARRSRPRRSRSRRRCEPVVPRLRRADRRQRGRAWPARWPTRASASCRAAPTTTSCSSTSDPPGITGKAAQVALDRAGITCNKNTIPFDPETPFVTSGIRLGTAAVTTAGMREEQMGVIAVLDRAGAAQARRPRCRRRREARRQRPVRPVPALPGACVMRERGPTPR